jgi:hypothetical protein
MNDAVAWSGAIAKTLRVIERPSKYLSAEGNDGCRRRVGSREPNDVVARTKKFRDYC